MLCAVNRNQHEFIFGRESGNFMRIDGDPHLPTEKAFQGKRPGMVAKGQLGVKLNQQLRARLPENILTRNLFRLDCCRRNSRFISEADHQFRRTQNVRIAQNQIEIAVLAQPGIAIATRRKDRPLDDQRFDTSRGEGIEYSEHLRGQIQGEHGVEAGPVAEFLAHF
jgi:hypothetical protein